MSRYDGKPFLRLLECYILNSIGQLDNDQQTILCKMEPMLSDTYSMNGSWLDIVNRQMDFPESFPDTIREVWSDYLGQAKTQGVCVDPNEFAISFVDQNFGS